VKKVLAALSRVKIIRYNQSNQQCPEPMAGVAALLVQGIAEIDNNAAERALRCVALGRKNFLLWAPTVVANAPLQCTR
jgi:hypothetical protein